ncbi:MAG TPA: YbaN family protein [Alcaligenes sp.]|nr:YbaN family protein [Alcaligenes sp.]HRL27472.1 YbaN family protein [Alcaligenes sp.]
MRILLLAAGLLCVALAVAGTVLPLLPTTPFALLAAWCFARSSPRFHQWLLEHRWLGPYLRNWQDGRGLTRRAKQRALVLLWLSLALSAWLAQQTGWLRLLLLIPGVAVTRYLLRCKTLPDHPPVQQGTAEPPRKDVH